MNTSKAAEEEGFQAEFSSMVSIRWMDTLQNYLTMLFVLVSQTWLHHAIHLIHKLGHKLGPGVDLNNKVGHAFSKI